MSAVEWWALECSSVGAPVGEGRRESVITSSISLRWWDLRVALLFHEEQLEWKRITEQGQRGAWGSGLEWERPGNRGIAT